MSNSTILLPRIIHQIWWDLGSGPNPGIVFQPAIQSWKQLHPNWQYKLWNKEECYELIKEVLGNQTEEIDWFDGREADIIRIDAIRCCILYKFGGMYVDTDYVARQPFDGVFRDLEQANPHGCAAVIESASEMSFIVKHSNCMLLSTKSHPFWMDHVWPMMKLYSKRANMIPSKTARILITGPYAVSQAFKTYKKLMLKHHQSTTANENAIVTLPKAFFNPCGSCSDTSCDSRSGVMASTFYAHSWGGNNGYFKVFQCWVWNINGIIAIIVIILLICLFFRCSKQCLSNLQKCDPMIKSN
jgi:mannosyltransferase OCH1-like enzyme